VLQPDLILLDTDLPDLKGFEVCRLLKADPATMIIPIIFLTGASSTEEKIKGLHLGALDYLTKPFDAAELLLRVGASLRIKSLLDLLSEKAMIDGLTGLWNRSYLDRRLPAELSLSARTGWPFSCVMADVDHFKAINDTYGHAFGDLALRATSQVFAENSRAEDIVCRYGGEEFAILLPGVGVVGGAAFAERLRDRISQLILPYGGGVVRLTCSFGVAEISKDNVAGASPIQLADQALYQAKTTGRNRVVAADSPMIERTPTV